MKSINEEGLYEKTVSSTLAALARNFPERAAIIEQAHQELLQVDLDDAAPNRLLAAMPPGQGASSIMGQAVRDVASKVGMRAIVGAEEIDALADGAVDPQRDLVFLSSSREDEDRAFVGRGPTINNILYSRRLLKARDGALFFNDMQYSVQANDRDDAVKPVLFALADSASEMVGMLPNEVYMTRLVSMMPEAQLRDAINQVSARLHLGDLSLETFGFKQGVEGFLRHVTQRHGSLKTHPLSKMVDMLEKDPDLLAASTGPGPDMSMHERGFATPRSWRTFFDEVDGLAQQNGQVPSAEKIKELAEPLLGAETAGKLATVMQPDYGNDAVAITAFSTSLGARRRSGDPSSEPGKPGM